MKNKTTYTSIRCRTLYLIECLTLVKKDLIQAIKDEVDSDAFDADVTAALCNDLEYTIAQLDELDQQK